MAFYDDTANLIPDNAKSNLKLPLINQPLKGTFVCRKEIAKNEVDEILTEGDNITR